MTYARARLWLGISGVGFFVVLAGLGLLFQVPTRIIGDSESSSLAQLGVIALLVLGYILASTPFDFLGGYWLPKRYGRPVPAPGLALFGWVQGVVVQGVILIGSAWLLVELGRRGGVIWALVGLAVVMLSLIGIQPRLARFLGRIRRTSLSTDAIAQRLDIHDPPAPPLETWEARDLSFSGGIVGLFRNVVIVPAHWVRELDPDQVALQLTRRIGLIRRRWRLLGLVIALTWNLVGFGLAATLIPGAGVSNIDELATTALGFTLWSFLGLLVLPSVSRPGIFAADRFALEHGADRDRLVATMEQLDRWQEDEPARSRAIETIFHPIPSIASRRERLERPEPVGLGAWQAARMALYLSWPCLGLLGRAVHCNSGRPELWVLLPSD